MDLTFLKIKDLDIGIENMFISPRLFFQDGRVPRSIVGDRLGSHPLSGVLNEDDQIIGFVVARRMFLEHTDVIDRLEEGLLAVDTKGNVTLINKSARQMLGLEKEESSQAEIDKLLSQNQEIRPSIKYTKH